ncbi:SafA/ExsA family spore coat assembly protein [Halobacillus litoralis]|uniref:SafA/ExsA family spore coat assembly protein n=1 Tax=Halobacillus litoralis TaxID=45668 RepID=UPI001CD7084A|nr:SafA/ExsA family spore coat assembly protein [Halobacillus litoralis]MCA0969950.1 SafA/ExsA family spore coat assembly protein [Halobacillus litoralis]
MRIHIVQKGDTLWTIAKKYGVDFAEVKAMNTQLSNPDMIMPGMKIKVPQGTKPVKKETQMAPVKKEAQVKTPYKDTSPKPMPVIKEDEKEKPVKGVMQKPMMPIQPQPQPINMNMQMPSIDQQMQNYYTTFHLPQMPMAEPEESSESVEQPVVKGVEAPMAQPMPQMPMQPQLMHSDCYCCPPHPMQPMQMPMHHQMPMNVAPMQGCGPMGGYEESPDMVAGTQAGGDCGCGGGGNPQPYGYGPGMAPGGQMPYAQQPHMQQPYMPQQNPYGQMPQGGGWYPGHGPGPGQGQWSPYGPWQGMQGPGYPQMGQNPWRDDDLNEE